MSGRPSRRAFTAALCGSGLALASPFARPALAQASPKVVVVGGGFAGATAARALRHGGAAVTLVEPRDSYVACPLSNSVIAGLRPIEAQLFGYNALRREGISLARSTATAVEVEGRRVTLADGSGLAYDRLVWRPGSI
jgi:NADH dehydrogenase FAD-containing subunit